MNLTDHTGRAHDADVPIPQYTPTPTPPSADAPAIAPTQAQRPGTAPVCARCAPAAMLPYGKVWTCPHCGRREPRDVPVAAAGITTTESALALARDWQLLPYPLVWTRCTACAVRQMVYVEPYRQKTVALLDRHYCGYCGQQGQLHLSYSYDAYIRQHK